MVLPTSSSQARKCPQLSQPKDRHAAVVLGPRCVVLPDGGYDDFVAALVEFLPEELALDLRSADVWRIVVGSEEDAQCNLPFRPGGTCADPVAEARRTAPDLPAGGAIVAGAWAMKRRRRVPDGLWVPDATAPTTTTGQP
jgi:hypothetical protein